MEPEGYWNIVGRINDMLIRGGENLYPREIKDYLYRHPKIQEVQVFGVADELYGEELCAYSGSRSDRIRSHALILCLSHIPVA